MSVLTIEPVDLAEALRTSPYHPHVDHYRDGGLGGLGPDHSVVGFVATSTLVRYRHHDGLWNGIGHHPGGSAYDRQVIAALRRDLRAGVGFHTPLMLEYDHRAGWAYLGEGNHRLASAVAEQVPEVPVRVVRSCQPTLRHDEGVGAPAKHRPIPGCVAGYLPTDVHPAYLNLT